MGGNLDKLRLSEDTICDKERDISYLIKKGEKQEKLSHRNSAIISFEKAIFLLEDNKDYRSIQLYIRIGDLYQIEGQTKKVLASYHSAYKIALLSENKFFQVDALAKLTEVYSYMGEVGTSIEYAKKADDLLKNLDYTQGKLEISLFWLRTYYLQNEFYKAREIGIEALKLCGDEHFYYKGRILNTLAKLYSEIASVYEHLELLKKALDCFEKANCSRGILGVTNNIGTVYADKLQDNKLALEYFIKLKKLSEDSEYGETSITASINLGELFYKSLKYQEALFYFREGLEKAQITKLGPLTFCAYIGLIDTSIAIYDYRQASNYFDLANSELKSYPDQGEFLPWYYKAAANLYLQFGELAKAKKYIKQALDLLGNEETMIKWNAGIIYELIKLKEAKNTAEVLETIEGVKFIIAKYKNPELIMNTVYDIALRLIDMNYNELAFRLIDGYNHLKSKLELIKLKHIYIKAFRCENTNNDKIKNLNSALKLSMKIKNSNLHWRICNNLEDYYFETGNFQKAKYYHKVASILAKDIVLNVPEKFRTKFIASNKINNYEHIE